MDREAKDRSSSELERLGRIERLTLPFVAHEVRDFVGHAVLARIVPRSLLESDLEVHQTLSW